MKDETPVKHGYGHDPLPLTINQVAQFLVGHLTLNPHISRDAVPEAHCISQAGMSVDTFMQARLCDGPGDDTLEDVVGDVYWVSQQCFAALDLRGDLPRFDHDLIHWEAMPLVAYALLVLPRDQENTWLGFFFRYVLQMLPSDIQKFRERVIDEVSQVTLHALAEKGRLAFNALHVDDPTPEKQYPVEAELAEQRENLHVMIARLGDFDLDTGDDAPPPTRKPH